MKFGDMQTSFRLYTSLVYTEAGILSKWQL